MQNTINVNDVQKVDSKTTYLGLITFALMFFTVSAIAGSGGDAFQGLFDELVSFAEGVPGQIIAFCSFAGIIIFSMVRPNLIGLGVSVIIMLVLAQLQTIITTMLTAGLPV
ncbi:hypothetical protein AB4559_08250 [Vibrio sp. 10N.222.51.C8]|jgi:hypothetical protein|uniref:Pili assembly chaperone n=4 Tax=Vibrio TaxID=662 RepID=A0A7Z1S674_9VIBR|nr:MULTISPECIES: hypothetical protein [Vibrio]OQQ07291.1 hypothetical protein BK411_13145 [Vibrio splendidus]CAK2438720.1 conjugal transfer pilus assembly protein TraA [Vibrio crassostreae]KAA8675590.1 hypothetical protein F4W18_13265 [Vibrio gigantis]MCG9692039.1 hypothetical protein [Vibrio sp. Isolate22]MDA0155211.1 hypothetical protein [Vibrio sp. Makdt]